VTLTVGSMAQHSHALQASTAEGTENTALNNVVGTSPSISIFYQDDPNPNASLNIATIGFDGGSQAHANVQPFQAINYIISLYGVFPPPS
jgi:microcystin-dependent protein